MFGAVWMNPSPVIQSVDVIGTKIRVKDVFLTNLIVLLVRQ